MLSVQPKSKRVTELACLGGILAGLAGNYFKFPIFLNIDFLFGSIFALLVLQFFGLSRGVFAAALISSYTYILWNHPYAIIIMTAEVAVVGLLASRYRLGLVFADVLYWLCLGMPLVYLFYGVIMGATNSVTIVMVKQATNGIANALVARLIFTALVFNSRKFSLTMREMMANLLSLFVLLPMLSSLMIDSRNDFREVEEQIITKLTLNSLHMTGSLNQWLEERRFTLVNLASQGAVLSTDQMQKNLEQVLSTDQNIVRYCLVAEDASLRAMAPLPNLGEGEIGAVCANASLAAELRQTIQPMLTVNLPEKSGTVEPAALLLVPVIVAGQYTGSVIGELSSKRLLSILQRDADETMLYTLVDRNNLVITTNQPSAKPQHPYSRGLGSEQFLAGGIIQWVPEMPKNIAIAERWKESRYALESMVGGENGWKLILELPVSPFQQALYARYSEKFTLLYIMLLVALGCAEFLSRRVLATTEQLSMLTSDLAGKVADDGAILTWPESRLLENNRLIRNFRAMADELSVQFAANRQARYLLEQRVEERTKALRESRNLFRTLASHAPVGIFQTDPHGQCIFVNAKWCALSGLTAEEAMGAGWALALHPEEREKVFKAWQEAVQSRDSFSLEYRFVLPDGGSSWVYGLATPLPAEEGELSDYIGCVVDISERRHFEDALRESESNFRNLVETIDDLIVVATRDGQTLFANQAFERKLGFSATDLAAMHLLDLHGPKDRQEAEVIFSDMFQGKREFCLLPVYTKDKKRFPVQTRVWPGTWNGAHCIFGLIKDLTAEQEAQQRFERLFRSNPTLMALTTLPERRFVDVNETFLRTLGYGKSEVIGKTAVEVGLVPDQVRLNSATDLLVAAGHVAEFEMPVRCKDGRLLEGLFSGEIIHSQEKAFALTVMIDITERKKAIEEIRQSKEAAIAADTAKTRLLSTVAHEFRTPLSLLSSSLEILDRYGNRLSQERRSQQETFIRRASDQLKSLVETIISYNQTDKAVRPQAPQMMELQKLIATIAGEVRQIWQQSRELIVDVAADCLAHHVDAVIYRRILVNLLGNALQYSAPGGSVSLRVARADSFLVIEIIDQGIGIPEEEQARVFEPFFRGSNVGMQRGVGLGLDIVSDTVRQLQGTVTLISHVGEGTTVVVKTPWMIQPDILSLKASSGN